MNKLYRIILFLSVFFIGIDICYASETEIAVIKSQDIPIYKDAYNGFKMIFSGKTREFDLKGNPDDADEVVIAIKENPPDMILAIGLLAARVAKENFPHTPVIFCMVYDPLRLSLSGDNISGISLETQPSDTFQRIKDFFPQARRVGVLFDPKKSGKMVNQAIGVAQKFGFSLITEEVNSAKLLPYALRALQNKIDLLWMIPDSTVVTAESIDFIFMTALQSNIPVIAFSEDMVRKGAIIAITPDYKSVGEQAGRMAAEVLKGKKAGKIPVSFANKIRTLVNPGLAKKIGIDINMESLHSLSYQLEFYSFEKSARNIRENTKLKSKVYE
ncbi:MAG: ABC transporter substrate-binding protein [Nitrospira sp.]|nr:ABC transporter substrate-binding protein [Nitrospira sp.]